MATYSQVLKSTSQGRRQLWCIWGKEPALVQDAYELATTHVMATNIEVSKVVFLGEEVSLFELEHALTRDFDEDRLLVVLLNSSQFKEWEELTSVLKGLDSSRFFIAVSSTEPAEDVKKVFLKSSKVRYVVCSRMTSEDLQRWIESRLEISFEATKYLLGRAHGDYMWLLNQIKKLELLNMPKVEIKLVKALCSSQGRPNFVLSLINNQKIAALSSIEQTLPSPREMEEFYTLLQKYMVISESAERVGSNHRMMTERTGFSPQDISVLKEHAVKYGKAVSTRRLAILVKLHEGIGRSSRLSYLSLISRW